MFKQIPPPSEDDLKACFGPDFAMEWDQARVSRWLQEHNWGHIADTFQEHGICGKEFFHISLAKLVEILPRRVTTYAERRRLLNDIRALGTPAAAHDGILTPTNISINTNVHQPYPNNEHHSFPTSANTPTSAHLASSSSPTTPLNHTSSSQYEIKDLGSGFSHMSCSRHSAGGTSTSGGGLSSPSSIEFPSPVATSTVAATSSSSSTTPTTNVRNNHHHRHHHYHSPTRLYSPRSAISKIRNTFMHSTSTSSSNNNNNNNTSSGRMNNTESEALSTDASDNRHSSTATSRTPDRLNKFWAAYANWRSGGSSASNQSYNGSHRKGQQQQNHYQQVTSTFSSSSSSGALPEMNHNLVAKVPMTAHKRFSDTRIQVTGDRETWYSVVVTDIRDADTLKDRILQRMNLPLQHRDGYCYYHENGPDPEMALTSQDLLAICSIADHAANQRILVCAIKLDPGSCPGFEFPNNMTNTHYQPHPPASHMNYNVDIHSHLHPTTSTPLYGNATYSLSTPELGHSPSDTPSTPKGVVVGGGGNQQGSSSPILLPDHGAHPNSKPLFLFANTSTAAVLPNIHHHHNNNINNGYHHEPAGIQLSDPPAATTYPLDENAPSPAALQVRRASDHQIMTNTTTVVVEPSISYDHRHATPITDNNTPSSSSSKERRSNKLWTRRSEPMLNRRHLFNHARPMATQQQQQQQVPPSPHSSTFENNNAIPKPAAQLWAVPPTKAPTHPPSSPRYSATHHQSNKNAFWGERPPAEVVCQNMDQYFDNHDLDKEIIVEEDGVATTNNMTPQQQPVVRRLTHTKSIRVVAREASKKYNTARKIKEGGMLRRKSTKLWGQHLVEVKPARRRRQDDVSTPSPSSGDRNSMMFLDNNNSGTGQNQSVQWIRGKLIGKGSFGRVYLAFNVATGEVIAVKQVEIPRTKSDRQDTRQLDMVDALYQEMYMLRDLDHDNIVQYLGYGRDNDVVNIFLEYVSGGSISSRLSLQGAFEEPLVRYFTRQIVAGLNYLHGRNILHRDIKAANILVEADGICKISDFGLSKKNDYDEVYDENSRMSLRGSIYWMAPEVVKNEPYSAKVDIWSLGCTVIEMFTGQRPWLTLNQIATLYNLGCQKSPTLPENISDIGKDFLTQCFIIDPNKRPTAATLLTHPFCQPDPTFRFTDYIDKGKV